MGIWVPSGCRGRRETKREFDPRDSDRQGVLRWKAAYKELLARLASQDIPVVGRANGVPELVPGFNFVACPVDYPFQDTDVDLHFSGELYLESYSYFGEEESSKGGMIRCGSGVNRDGPALWSRRKLWPSIGLLPYRKVTGLQSLRGPARPEGHPSCIFCATNSRNAARLGKLNPRWQSRYECFASGLALDIRNRPYRPRPRPKIACVLNTEQRKGLEIDAPQVSFVCKRSLDRTYRGVVLGR
jgi:hypothetical protein